MKAIDEHINESWKQNRDLKVQNLNTFDAEIMHHAIYCNNILNNTVARDKILLKAKQFLKDFDDLKPFYIGGEIASGKTYSIACLARLSANESPNNVVLIRFIGTSTLSSTVKSLLQTLIYQMWRLLRKNTENEALLQKMGSSELKNLFLESLQQFSCQFQAKKLLIFIDSIDRLYEEDPEYRWIIHDLPKNVKFLYSTTTVQNNALLAEQAFKLDAYGFHSQYIRDFESTEAVDILNEWLKEANRQLTEIQQVELANLLEKAKLQPLFLKLIFNIINKWPSSFRPDIEFRFCLTIKDALKYFFDKLEKIHSRMLLTKCLFYFNQFKSGISETQLIDILSLDNELLSNIMSSSKNVQMKRFPPLYWFRLKQDLMDFLIEKELNGYTILSW